MAKALEHEKGKPCEWCESPEDSDGVLPCDCWCRALCPSEGKFAHWSCGFCQRHDQPRFRCSKECHHPAGNLVSW
jgi:hypothetical protein